VTLEGSDGYNEYQRERPWACVVEESCPFDDVAASWKTAGDVVQRSFEFNTTQPSPVWQPVEDSHAGVEFEIQFVGVRATITGPFGRAEFIDNIKMRAEPTGRALRGKPHKIVSNSSSGVLSASNGKKITSTVNSNHDTRVGRPSDRITLELGFASATGDRSALSGRSGRPKGVRERNRGLDQELRRAEEAARPADCA
jgi:hypothetical protein